jgi:hypothetical protein
MNIPEELQKLDQMRQSGALSDEEFAKAKASLLNSASAAAGPGIGSPSAYDTQGRSQMRQWCMFIHFSQFAGYIIPFAGLIVPIILWQMKKADPEVNAHGKMVLNWIISALIYFVVCLLLTFVFIGIPMFFALGLVAIVFPIIGGIKANNGELWKYPMTISFF